MIELSIRTKYFILNRILGEYDCYLSSLSTYYILVYKSDLFLAMKGFISARVEICFEYLIMCI